MEVAGLDAHGSPGGGDEGRLEPVAANAKACAAALAGALVVARAHAGPGQQVAGGGADLPQRSRQSILQCRLPESARRLRHAQFLESQGQLLGQCAHGKPVGLAQGRQAARQGLQNPARRYGCDRRLADVLQPPAAAFVVGLRQSDAIRTGLACRPEPAGCVKVSVMGSGKRGQGQRKRLISLVW